MIDINRSNHTIAKWGIIACWALAISGQSQEIDLKVGINFKLEEQIRVTLPFWTKITNPTSDNLYFIIADDGREDAEPIDRWHLYLPIAEGDSCLAVKGGIIEIQNIDEENNIVEILYSPNLPKVLYSKFTLPRVFSSNLLTNFTKLEIEKKYLSTDQCPGDTKFLLTVDEVRNLKKEYKKWKLNDQARPFLTRLWKRRNSNEEFQFQGLKIGMKLPVPSDLILPVVAYIDGGFLNERFVLVKDDTKSCKMKAGTRVKILGFYEQRALVRQVDFTGKYYFCLQHDVVWIPVRDLS